MFLASCEFFCCNLLKTNKKNNNLMVLLEWYGVCFIKPSCYIDSLLLLPVLNCFRCNLRGCIMRGILIVLHLMQRGQRVKNQVILQFRKLVDSFVK